MMMNMIMMKTMMVITILTTVFTLIANICAGGDLVFFIDGLQKTVKEVKKMVGEDVPEEALRRLGGGAV